VGTHAFLQQVQESARKASAVFILDEVQTSRLAPGGLQELEGLKPDMTTLGKFLGGGITFGAFGGREEVMRVYDPRESKALGHSGTFNARYGCRTCRTVEDIHARSLPRVQRDG